MDQQATPVVGYVEQVFSGKVAPLGARGVPSGINKQPVDGAVQVTPTGLAGDEQADTRAHGGIDKAVHCYSLENYPRWQALFPHHPMLRHPGAFGENFSVRGLDETSVCMADVWRIGTAVFQVSQGRQPCFKLNLRFNIPDMARRVQDSLWAGWYLRVLTPGVVQAGDAIELLERPFAGYPVAYVLSLIRDRATDPAILQGVLALPLPSSWRRLFQGRQQSGQVEDWSSRLEG
jgi:MOSC domain-containing protein YiiM